MDLLAEPQEGGGGDCFPEKSTDREFEIGAARAGLGTTYDRPADALRTNPGRSEEEEEE